MFELDALKSSTCSRAVPAAVFGSLQAVVLIFFLLMWTPSFLSSNPAPCIAMMNQSCHGGNLRHIHALQRSLQDEGTSLRAKSFNTLLQYVQPFSVSSSGFRQSMRTAVRNLYPTQWLPVK